MNYSMYFTRKEESEKCSVGLTAEQKIILHQLVCSYNQLVLEVCTGWAQNERAGPGRNV